MRTMTVAAQIVSRAVAGATTTAGSATAAATNAVRLSLAPAAPLSFARSHYGVDWKAWMMPDAGGASGQSYLFGEVVPQLYRSSAGAFSELLNDTLHQLTAVQPVVPGLGTAVIFGAGLRGDGSGESTPWADLAAMLDQCDRLAIPPCLWYSRGVLTTYKSQLTHRWNPTRTVPAMAPRINVV